ncbi:MAG: penicillin-binding protein 2 [Melioribacteraceae bacterium]|nr:penicillin-binding protein 2 [Melioribacteraceae bacterium]
MNDSFFGSYFRKNLLLIIIIGFSFIVGIQLFSMQIVEQSKYSEKSDDNSVKPVYQTAPRGIFFDRSHNVLVGNKPSFTLRLTPADYDTKLNGYVESMLGFSDGYISKVLKDTRQYSKFIPRRILKDASFKVIAWYEENQANLPGIDYIMETQRDYSFGVNGSHMFGYTKEISADMLRKRKGEYEMGDNIGFNGIEKTYEEYIRGTKGIKYVLVDSKQKTIGRYKNGETDKPAEKGYDLILSIDKDAQVMAESLFVGKRGSVVAIEPSTGEIIAFLSSPGYNLADFASVTSNKIWRDLNNDPEKPLFNRATMSIYSPGSTYKMLAAITALEEGIIDTNYRINCGGGFQFGNRFFKCLHVHGSVDVKTSIEKSCNTFYYSLILKIGLERWAKYSRMFGFGHKTGVDITEENSGLVPDQKYYDRVFGKDRYPKGILISLGIGQGELSVTPIQLAQYVALLANNGKSAKPHFIKGFIKNLTNEYLEAKPEYFDLGISKHSFDIVRDAMFRVVNGVGTAGNIRTPEFTIAGKTGTAQNPHGNDHAIFVGFAPYDNPKIAIAVIVENAGFGSTHAAPIARDIMKAYLVKNKKVAANAN